MQTLELVGTERLRRLRRTEYDQMVELGVFANEKVELLLGVMLETSPQGTRHASSVQELGELLTAALLRRAKVRQQLPLAATEDSEPEPDLAVVPLGRYDLAHPSTAQLVIEVADTSQHRDRELKAGIYAATRVPEYWVVDVTDGSVTRFTLPSGDEYTTAERFERGSSIALLAFPDVTLALDDFLPL